MFIWVCAKMTGEVRAKTLKQVLDSAKKRLAKSEKAGKLVRILIMNKTKEKLGEWSVRVPAA